ncbi:alpha/beta fold hydrolase [Telmatospirillum sp.]|uniref:alpha/beta hydrolase family esterase n=1 Tax=Telmatospirillum sp. TaxID=2079197 RepID=UPI00283D85A6|nr:alpha/beta fold hydrolase [Telmatospirillum sp.]MDR3436122.1 alpha/beta fold hydrolase [Telmatospirillum sp.]
MRPFFAHALCLLAILLLAGEASASTMEFDGRERTFEMYVPPTAPRPLPIVLILHGGKGTATLMRRYTDFDALAAKEDILAVYPQGVGGQWNDGRPEIGNISSQSADANDVDFLLALVDNLVSHGLADPKRVYVIGISNGGMMAMRLACEHPGRIAGIAAVSANLPIGLECDPQTPVPALFFHGTNDKFMPFGGGDILQWANIDRGKVLSARETVALWRQIDGCSGEPHKLRISDGSKKGGLVIDQINFDPCSGATVQQFITRGGGHAWPGAKQGPYGDAVLGPAGTDLDANAEIWSFFKAQPTR